MKKRILAMLLCLALIGSMLPVGVIAQEAETDPIVETEAPQEETIHQEEITAPVQEETAPVTAAACTHTSWTVWESTNSLPTASGSYRLSANVDLTDTWKVADGQTINLCLGGFNITQTTSGKRTIEVTKGTLNIYDCAKTGKITGAKVTVNGGAIIANGKNVNVSLYDITLSGNQAQHGGAVAVHGGAIFAMTGGKITGNTATGQGGGLYVVDSGSKATLDSVTVTGNTTTSTSARAAGGVHVNANNSTTLKGKVIIDGNFKGTGANKAPSNLEVDYDRLAIDNALSADSSIGLSVYPEDYTQVISLISKAAVDCYFSDDPNKIPEVKGNILHLVAKPVSEPVHANTEGYTACDHDKLTWTAWEGTNAMPTASGSYFLAGEVKLTDAWTIGEGQNITICLNGHNITQTGTKQVIVMTGGKLNICDCTAKTENGVYSAGKITGANTSERGAGLNAQGGAEFNLYDGCIEGNTSSSYGGGVYVHTATFNMYGGSIAKNHADAQSGGALCTNGNGIINITGGTITGNTAKNAGAIAVQGAGNEVLLKDCSITGNSATGLGGGVYVGKPDSVTVSGKLNITGNTVGSNKSNLFVVSTASEARPVAQKDLDKTSTIGIGIYNTTKSNVLVSSGATEDTKSCYIPDDDTKIIEYKNGQLLLAEKPVFVPVHANTEGYTACDHDKLTWTGWASTTAMPTASGNYFLGADVKLSDSWKLAEGVEITLCLNGYDIIQEGTKQVIVMTGGKLNICDCTAKTENGVYSAGKITGANTSERGAGLNAQGGAEFNLYDGCIEGNTSSSYGGGVYVHTATFNMYGGSIAKNHADSQSGGALCTNGNGIINITGGTITGNTAKNAGAIAVQGAGNEVLLKDCSITGNSATGLGGGVYVGKPDSVTVSGKLNITGNTVGSNKSNLFVVSTASEERAVIQKDLDAASTIGIGIYLTTKSNVLVKSGATEATLSCYTPDDDTKIIEYKNGQLLLADKPAFVPVHANTEGYTACDHDKLTWIGWDKTDSLPTQSGNYFLGADVELTKAWNAGEDKEITICLNGYSISQKTEGQRVIRVGGSTLNICDCTAKTEDGVYTAGKITGGNTDASDAAGNAGAMMLTNGGTFRLYDGMITGNHTEGNGVIVAQKDFTFEMHGGCISANTAGKQGGAVFLSKSAMVMTGGEISGNEAVGSGGAIYISGGELTVSGGVIAKNNSTTGGGGGIALKNSGADKAVLEISGGEIRENTSKLDGSGIRMDSGKLTVSGGKIIKNGTETGSAGAMRLGDGEVTISGGLISENIGSNAAAILAVCDVTMTGGEVSGNIGTGNGAGVYISGATFNFSGGKIVKNQSGGQGAGVFLVQATLEMTGGEISENQAGGMGGGISGLGGIVNIKDGKVMHNTAGGGGGGIYAVSRTDDSGKVTAQTQVNISGGKVNNNTSKLMGGGIRMDDGKFTLSGGEIGENKADSDVGGVCVQNGTVTITEGRIVKNTAGNAAGLYANACDVTMSGGLISTNIGGGNGAGVYVANSTFKLSGGYIRFNESTGNGGGIFASQSEVEISGGEIQSNQGGMGGGIYNNGGTLTVKGGIIKTNNAYKLGGGGIYSNSRFAEDKVTVIAQATLTISGGEITGNKAQTDGAGVRADSGKFKMTNGIISANAATGSCGGMSLKNVEAEISGGTITKNKATNAAGVYINSGTLTISGGEISHNAGTGSGAGVMASASEVKFSGGVIEENSAKGDGAGLYVSNCKLNLCGGKILKNRAEKVCGGLIASKNSRVTFTGGTISGNTAKGSSGGVMLQTGSTMRMSGGTVSNNIAVNYGGGIYVNKNSALTLTGGTISGNAARKGGGGVYVGKDSKMTMSGGKITGNDAKTQGGGLTIVSDTTITGGTISKNTSKREGAGFYISNATVEFSGGTVEKNITEYNGGGICVRGETGILKISDDAKILQNECKESGGGILVQGQGYLEMDGGEVKGNFAPNGGGGIRLHNCGAVIKNAKINGNTSNGAGAGIYSNLSLEIKDSEVCDNKIVANPDISVARSSAAIRTYNESTLLMENVKVTGNTCDGRAGAIEIAYNVDATVKNCTFKNNTATERGGTFSIYREGQLYMYDCTVQGGSTDGNGGAFSLDAYGEIYLTGCSVTGNQADMGGVAYVGTKGVVKLTGCTVKDNVAKSHASVIWANGSVTLEDTVITGNKDKKGGAAVYLDNDGQDNESYMPGVFEIIGNTTVCNNDGGDMVLVNNAFLSIHGDGLGADSKIQVKLQDDDITRWVVGPYSYEANDKGFLLTKGEQSLSEAFMGEAQSVADEQTQEGEEQEQKASVSLPVIIGASGVAMVLLLVIIAVAVLGKKKKK